MLAFVVAVGLCAGPPSPFAGLASADAFRRLQALYDGLEFENVVPRAQELSQRSDLSAAQTIEIYRLWGSSLAALDAPVEAERPFRLLLRLQPDFRLPSEAAPKIVAVFAKVQAEEKVAAETARAVERARLIARIELSAQLPTEGRGGRPLEFHHRLKDPAGAVETLKVAWRKKGSAAYSSLALAPQSDGWRGSLPGELTASADGFTLECFVEAADRVGTLVAVGSAGSPHQVAIAPGQVKAPRPLARWAFWVPFGGALGAWAASAAVGGSFVYSQNAYRQYAFGGGDLDNRSLLLLEERGGRLAATTNAMLVTAAALSALSAVLGLFFVNWE